MAKSDETMINRRHHDCPQASLLSNSSFKDLSEGQYVIIHMRKPLDNELLHKSTARSAE